MPKAGSHTPNSYQAVPVLRQIAAVVDSDRVAPNLRNVNITKDELENAFAFLDLDGRGTINLNSLRKSLGKLFPDISLRDLKFLMNNSRDLSIEDLWELIQSNDVSNFDPVAEAYTVYDSEGRGNLEIGKISDVFISFGLGEITSHEMELLHKTADLDGDGVISLFDFRSLLELAKHHLTKKSVVKKKEGGSECRILSNIGESFIDAEQIESKIMSITEVHSLVKMYEGDQLEI